MAIGEERTTPLSSSALETILGGFLSRYKSTEERLAAIKDALSGMHGEMLRSNAAKWIVDSLIPPEKLVPEKHANWVPVVRDAMLYVGTHLSTSRLASKLLEQIELPSRTRAETRLLQLISKVPGLQKLGQVLARNRHLSPALRRALSNLENGIRDVAPEEIGRMLRKGVGARMQEFDVRLARKILSEASVSAIVRFTWKDPETGERKPGVFKILKPYIPEYFSEDMAILQGLTAFFSSRLHDYGFSSDVLPDTFTKVRRLLQHEVDFLGEQRALRRASELYRPMKNVRVPQLIEPLCTAEVTALTEEAGTKVTTAVGSASGWRRQRIAEQLVEALIVLPLFTSQPRALFHADPHAGNLLYDLKNRKLVIVDWALTEELTREQRRHLALLFLYVGLRDPVNVYKQIEHLAQNKDRKPKWTDRVRSFVSEYLYKLPGGRLPTAVDAMRLVEHLTLKGVRFPASLVMLSKVLFTLDGILYDIGVPNPKVAIPLLKHMSLRLTSARKSISSPLGMNDWVAVGSSAMLYPARLGIKAEEAALDRLLPER